LRRLSGDPIPITPMKHRRSGRHTQWLTPARRRGMSWARGGWCRRCSGLVRSSCASSVHAGNAFLLPRSVQRGLKASSCDLLAPVGTPMTLHGARSSLRDHQHKMTYAILSKVVACTARGQSRTDHSTPMQEVSVLCRRLSLHRALQTQYPAPANGAVLQWLRTALPLYRRGASHIV
jgi:hypothetical protein